MFFEVLDGFTDSLDISCLNEFCVERIEELDTHVWSEFVLEVSRCVCFLALNESRARCGRRVRMFWIIRGYNYPVLQNFRVGVCFIIIFFGVLDFEKFEGTLFRFGSFHE